jgi:hypothetical protein
MRPRGRAQEGGDTSYTECKITPNRNERKKVAGVSFSERLYQNPRTAIRVPIPTRTLVTAEHYSPNWRQICERATRQFPALPARVFTQSAELFGCITITIAGIRHVLAS